MKHNIDNTQIMAVINQHWNGTRLCSKGVMLSDKYLMAVWSGDRDKALWPTASEYELIMPAEYRSVRRVSLLTAEFQSTEYVIGPGNNNMIVATAGPANNTVVTLPDGNYTPPDFAIALSAALNALPAPFPNVAVAYSSTSRKLSVTAGAGGLLFMLNDSITPGATAYTPANANTYIWDNMGFTDKSANVSIAALASLQLPDFVDLKEDRFLIMEIEQPVIMTGHMQTTGQHYNAFAKVIFDGDSSANFPADCSVYDFVSSPVEFRNIGKISRLKFRFRRPNGRVYNFHNIEHSFTLEFITK